MLTLLNQPIDPCSNARVVWADKFINRPGLWKPHESPDYQWKAGGSWFFWSPTINTYPADGKPYLYFAWGNFDGATFLLKPTSLGASCDQEMEIKGRLGGTYGPALILRQNGDNALKFWINAYWATLNADVIIGGQSVGHIETSIIDPNYTAWQRPAPSFLSDGRMFTMRSKVEKGVWKTELLTGGSPAFGWTLQVPDWPGEPWLEAYSNNQQSMWLESLTVANGPRGGWLTMPGAGGRIGRNMHGHEDGAERIKT